MFAASIVPMIVFMLGGGAVADRLGRRPVMLTADLVRCAAQGGLAAALLTGRPPLWLFAVAALAVGTGSAFFEPALLRPAGTARTARPSGGRQRPARRGRARGPDRRARPWPGS